MKYACILTLLVVFASLSMAAVTATGNGDGTGPVLPPAHSLDEAVSFILDHVDNDGCVTGSARNTAWAVMALVAAGYDAHKATPTGASLVDGLKACQPGIMFLGEELTAIQRHLMAIVAAGEDPTDFNGRNWEQEVRDAATGSGFFDPFHPNNLNNDMFGILALAAAGAPHNDPDIQNAADRLLDHQNSDGGWAHNTQLRGGDSDTDMTAAALQALVRAKRITPDDSVTQNALSFLQQRANDTDNSDHPGCLSTRSDLTQPDTDSTAWGLLGLLAVHQDPRSMPWGTHGGPWQCLLDLQQANGGFPSAPGASPAPWPTSYAILALTGSPFATIHPEMKRPTTLLDTTHTPIENQTVTLQAQGAAFVAWQHEDGQHMTGHDTTWTPGRSGVHHFQVLLLDDHGLAGQQAHVVLVMAQPAHDEDDPSAPGPDPDDPLPIQITLRLEAPDQIQPGVTVTLRFILEPDGTGPLRYKVDWGDHNTTDWLTGPQAHHTYTHTGTYTINAWPQLEGGGLLGPVQHTLEVEQIETTSQAAPLLPQEIPFTSLLVIPFTLGMLYSLRRRIKPGGSR